MEVLTVGQILSSVPGVFFGDESIRGAVVSNITHKMNELKKNSVYAISLWQENVVQFLTDNMEAIRSKGVALVVIPAPPPIKV